MVKSFIIGRIGRHKGGLSAEEIIEKIKNENVSLLATFGVHYLIEESMNLKTKMSIHSFLRLAQHGSFHKISITDFEIIYGNEEFRKIADAKELFLCPVFSDQETHHISSVLEEDSVESQVFTFTRFKLRRYARQMQKWLELEPVS